jgi:hypothetical protein
MPAFTMDEVSSIGTLVVTFFFLRRFVQCELADYVIRHAAQPSSVISKDAIAEKKFRDGCWKLFIHLFTVCYGMWALVGTDHFYDTRHFWIGYTDTHPLTPAIYWYYMIELGYYFTELLTHFISVQRKDFWQLFIHHVITLALVTCSYYHDFYRIGTVIMFYHDVMDPFLEVAKLAKQLVWTKFSHVMFCVLTLSYTYTRLYLMPVHVWHSMLVEGPEIVGWDHSAEARGMYYACNSMVAVLMALNVMWGWYLYAAIFRLFKGKQLADTRSDDEDEGHED